MRLSRSASGLNSMTGSTNADESGELVVVVGDGVVDLGGGSGAVGELKPTGGIALEYSATDVGPARGKRGAAAALSHRGKPPDKAGGRGGTSQEARRGNLTFGKLRNIVEVGRLARQALNHLPKPTGVGRPRASAWAIPGREGHWLLA